MDAPASNSAEELDIISACTEGDVEQVRAILAQDPSQANTRDNFIGSVPLIFASHRGFLEIVKMLLAAGAEVDARERASDTTALLWASEAGHPEVVRTLLDYGAKIDVADSWYELGPVGWATVVDWAPQFREDRPATADLLLSRGALMDPFSAVVREDFAALHSSTVDRRLGFAAQGRQPLHLAAAQGRMEIARLLLELGADPASLTTWGESPLAVALQRGHAKVAEVLRAAMTTPDLSAALFGGDLATARLLPLTDAHKFLLHGCAGAGLQSAVELLLERGADPNAEAPRLLGELPSTVTPLHLAALQGHSGVARLLLDHGADVHAHDKARQMSALHCAAESGRIEMVKLLLDRGADVNEPAGETGQTLLHFAAASGNLELIQLLLDRGADRSARDAQFESTPQGWAEFGGHVDAAELLK